MQLATLPPSKLLKQVNAKYGSYIWDEAFRVLQLKKKGVYSWPAECFIPWNVWGLLLFSSLDGKDRMMSPSEYSELIKVAAVGTWRYTQSVYRFTHELHKELFDSRLSGDTKIPSNVLLRLPEYCLYVEMPQPSINGFFAYFDYEMESDCCSLRILMDLKQSKREEHSIPIGDWSLDDAISKCFDKLINKHSSVNNSDAEEITAITAQLDNGKDQIRVFYGYIISLLLYITSDEPDIDHAAQEYPKRPIPIKTKKGMTLMPPEKPRILDVGKNISATLRKWQKEPTGEQYASTRPHIRRAHWHGYWRNIDNGKEFFYKWIPPILVNAITS